MPRDSTKSALHFWSESFWNEPQFLIVFKSIDAHAQKSSENATTLQHNLNFASPRTQVVEVRKRSSSGEVEVIKPPSFCFAVRASSCLLIYLWWFFCMFLFPGTQVCTPIRSSAYLWKKVSKSCRQIFWNIHSWPHCLSFAFVSTIAKRQPRLNANPRAPS